MLTALQIDFRDIMQIAILAALLYYLLRYIRRTRAAAMLMGFGTLVFIVFAAIRIFNLDVIGWLFSGLALYLALGAIIIFQPEFRRGLAMLGQHPFFNSLPWQLAHTRQPERISDKLYDFSDRLADQRIGALIAIERAESLSVYEETGVRLDAPLVSELLQTLFYPPGPLHDGGVIVRGERILAAGCIFPLTDRQRPELKGLGTRHQAAIGLSEASDAVVIVVSEETGLISIAHDGKLFRGVREDALRRYLRAMDPEDVDARMTFGRFLERLNQSPENWNVRGLRRMIRRKREVRRD